MIKIYPISEENKIQHFKLREVKDGIELVACEQDGQVSSGGAILHLSQNNGIHLYFEVNSKLGLPLDSKRRVIIK